MRTVRRCVDILTDNKVEGKIHYLEKVKYRGHADLICSVQNHLIFILIQMKMWFLAEPSVMRVVAANKDQRGLMWV